MTRLIVLLGVLALVLAACGGSAVETAGEEVFLSTCAVCHGTDAGGVEGLGKDLHVNVFVASNSDDEMVAFLQTGRGAGDPANNTGVAMPPRGGDLALTDDDLADVVAYLRTLE